MLNKKNLKSIGIVLVAILALNIIGNFFYYRYDLTKDKRYTLSQNTLTLIKEVKEPLSIKVYLCGELPSEFKRLQLETRQILEEFESYNSNINFEFINPLDDDASGSNNMEELYRKGLTPINISIDDKGKQSQEIVIPWAVAVYNNREVSIPLLKNIMGASVANKVIGSVQHLEYSLADAFQKLVQENQKKIAIIKGNGQLHEAYIAKFLLQIKQRYHIAPFTLDSVEKHPVEVLEALKKYDLAVVAKPTQAFSEEEKQVLDQYIINGGKTIWLIDQVVAEMDSLYSPTGSSLAFPRDLNLNDFFFKYGVRIYPNLIKDEQGCPIKLISGDDKNGTHFQKFIWKFAPQIYPQSKHPIVNRLGGIKFDFSNAIDTIKNGIKKTVLLQSSPYSKRVGTPAEINLNIVAEETTPKDYVNTGNIPVAVLLEGQFHSMFENRILAFNQPNFNAKGKTNKMIVISDGDVIKNQLDKDLLPLELGYDHRTGNLYDNKDFIINSVNYLLDDNGLINIRSKDIDLPLLDKEKIYENYIYIELVTIGLPIAFLIVFGILFTFLRKKIYSR